MRSKDDAKKANGLFIPLFAGVEKLRRRPKDEHGADRADSIPSHHLSSATASSTQHAGAGRD